MRAPVVVRPVLPSPSLLGMALWRLATAMLFGCSLLLVPHDLVAAVFALLASLVCLPEVRAHLREGAGLRIGGVAAAAGALGLMQCAVLSTDWQGESLDASSASGGVVVVSSTSSSKP